MYQKQCRLQPGFGKARNASSRPPQGGCSCGSWGLRCGILTSRKQVAVGGPRSRGSSRAQPIGNHYGKYDGLRLFFVQPAKTNPKYDKEPVGKCLCSPELMNPRRHQSTSQIGNVIAIPGTSEKQTIGRSSSLRSRRRFAPL
jgi:hypothetical protein